MMVCRHSKAYSLLYRFILFFISLSFLLRIELLLISVHNADLTMLSILRIFGVGLVFDFGVAVLFCLPYSIYLLIMPAKWGGSVLNRVLTYTGFFLTVLIIMLSIFSEYVFWREFETRFNFIAVDYLIYTYEVINNINESYPLPWLIGGVLTATALVVWTFKKRGYFSETFRGKTGFKQRLLVTTVLCCVATMYAFEINNDFAETGKNRYQDELAKAGIYSFFSAFKNNELNYEHFYTLIDNKKAFGIIRQQLKDSASSFVNNGLSIKRIVRGTTTPIKPNVIMITIESFSADFLTRFGNNRALTPVLDSLADKSILFVDMYATGTRTVRGIEALSLGIPPTPGSSIVRRPVNANMTTIGYIFQQKGYKTAFFYGGDGYFDNMNQYFGSNGYTITDRTRNLLTKDNFKARRNIIPDSLVRFENAWGISDEDLYKAVIRDADANYSKGKLFYDFVLTTSNHRPYTYPSGKIDIPSGSGREGAVKYTDYAIGSFLNGIKSKPWFRNTVLIVVADHCAGSAGKNEIDIDKYHIPAMINNLPGQTSFVIDKMCSQIDLYPTLFKLLGWEYESNLYGQDVLSSNYVPKILLGTYQKLAYMKNDSLVVLSPRQKTETFLYNKHLNAQKISFLSNSITEEAVSYYQTAFYLYKNGGLKQHTKNE